MPVPLFSTSVCVCTHPFSPFSLYIHRSHNHVSSSTPTSPLKSSQRSLSDPKHPLTLTEREALELRLAEKARDEKEYEEQEEAEEKERQPDLKKDDMMARRTGVFQKASVKVHNQFLPMPRSKKETHPDELVQKDSKSVSRDPFLDRNIKTKRFKVGQRWACMVWGMRQSKLSNLMSKIAIGLKTNIFKSQ